MLIIQPNCVRAIQMKLYALYSSVQGTRAHRRSYPNIHTKRWCQILIISNQMTLFIQMKLFDSTQRTQHTIKFIVKLKSLSHTHRTAHPPGAIYSSFLWWFTASGIILQPPSNYMWLRVYSNLFCSSSLDALYIFNDIYILVILKLNLFSMYFTLFRRTGPPYNKHFIYMYDATQRVYKTNQNHTYTYVNLTRNVCRRRRRQWCGCAPFYMTLKYYASLQRGLYGGVNILYNGKWGKKVGVKKKTMKRKFLGDFSNDTI